MQTGISFLIESYLLFPFNYRAKLYKPDFLHPTHWATFAVSYEDWIPDVVESASQTGVVENILQPSALLENKPQTLHAPFERHL